MDFRDLGITICDPLNSPRDSDLWLSLVYKAMGLEDPELMFYMIAARQFGQTVESSEKYGFRLAKPKYYADEITKAYQRHGDELIKILRELADDMKPGKVNLWEA